MPGDYDTRTTRTEVDGECPECGATELLYSRRVTRKFQIHIDCEACGATIKSKTDPTGLIEPVGVEYEEIIQLVEIRELDLDGMFRLAEISASDSSIEIEPAE